MDKLIIRIISLVISFSSTAAAAEDALGQLCEELSGGLKQLDSVVDTGFEVGRDKYSFGAQKQLDKDTRLNFGIGAKMRRSQDYNLSSSERYRQDLSQTNKIEDNFDPTDASPMIGASIGYKF